jgi:hypothetical protein
MRGRCWTKYALQELISLDTFLEFYLSHPEGTVIDFTQNLTSMLDANPGLRAMVFRPLPRPGPVELGAGIPCVCFLGREVSDDVIPFFILSSMPWIPRIQESKFYLILQSMNQCLLLMKLCLTLMRLPT